MKKKAWVTGGTCRDVAAIAVLVINIKETNPHIADEFIIYHDGISLKDQKLINSIFPSVFIEYSFPGNQDEFNATVKEYFSPMVFCKYECFTLLKDYEIIIWTDYDVVFTKNLTDLNITKKCSSGINLIPSVFIPVRDHFQKSIENINMGKYNLDADSYSLPFFVFHDNIRNYQMLHDWCIESTVKYAQYLYLPEQAIFNIMLQEFKIQPESELFIRIVHPTSSTKEELANAHQIHAYGQPKFWNGIRNEAWERYYRIWIKKGGSKNYFRTIRYVIQQRMRNIYGKIKKKVKLFFEA